MRHVLAAIFGVLALAAVVLTARDAGPARATGIGPNIELGTPVGLTVPVLATTAAVDPYRGFNIHVTTNASAGVSVNYAELQRRWHHHRGARRILLYGGYTEAR